MLALSIPWLTWQLGLSLALGAFLAGLMVSESEYSHRALGDMLPFRDLFTSFFFVSIGMLLDLKFVFQHTFSLLLLAALVIVLKFVSASTSSILLGNPLRTALLTGIALSQIGEFSFVLADSGMQYKLVGPDLYQFFIGVSVLTMAATPFLTQAGESIAQAALKLPLPEKLRTGLGEPEIPESAAPLTDHLIIIGFGLNGRTLSNAAGQMDVPHIIVDLNPDTVKAEKASSRPIFYGDAAQQPVLEYAHIENARTLAILIPDLRAMKRIILLARQLNPNIYIIVRTRFISQVKELYELGANDVIPEDYEVSVEILTRVLTVYLIPRNDIDEFVSAIRIGHFEMIRNMSYKSSTVSDLNYSLPGAEIVSIRVGPDAPAQGKSLTELQIRNDYGVSIVAIRRGNEWIPNPSAEERIAAGDILILLGPTESVIKSLKIFQVAQSSIGDFNN